MPYCLSHMSSHQTLHVAAGGRAWNMYPKILFHGLLELYSQTEKSVMFIFVYGKVRKCMVDDNLTGSAKGL